MAIFRDGSEDQVFGPDWDADHARPADDDLPTCEAGGDGCTGRAAVGLTVCGVCAALEQQRLEDGPSGDQANARGMEGGVRYDPDLEWQVRR